jgi:hypothetical protein
LCLININTRFAAAWPLDYKITTKYDIDAEWKPYQTRNRTKKKKNDDDEEHRPNKKPTSLKLLRKVRAKDSSACLKALMHCLIYLYHHDQKVEMIYSDDGSEFKGEVADFCSDIDAFFRLHPEQKNNWDNYEKDVLKVDRSTQRYRNKGKAFNMLPSDIPWKTFSPTEGSKRRLAIVERFNRTFKNIIRKNIYDPTEKKFNLHHNWSDYITAIMGQYNHLQNHRTLFEIMNDNHHYNPKKDQMVTPYSMSFVHHMDDGSTFDPEQEYINEQKAYTKLVWKWYKKHKKFKGLFKPGAHVITKHVANDGKIFTKKYDEIPNKGQIERQKGNTFEVYDLQKNKILPRRYLPWELALMTNKQIMDIGMRV